MQVDRRHLTVVDRDSGLIVSTDQRCFDTEASRRSRRADVPEGDVISLEGTGCPVLADLAEQSMLDRVPLRGPGRIVTDGHGAAEPIAELRLQGMLPRPDPGAVASAVVGQDEQFVRPRVPFSAFPTPPSGNSINREIGRVVGGTEEDVSPVGLHVEDAVGDRHAERVAPEVVIVHGNGDFGPDGSGILEPADHFLLLGIDADDREATLREGVAELLDVAELAIPVRMVAPGDALVVDSKRIAQIPEKARHGPR